MHGFPSSSSVPSCASSAKRMKHALGWTKEWNWKERHEFSTVVSCATLKEHLNDPDWRVFDCRHLLSDVGYGEKVAYGEGHLPGAFFLHLDRDPSGPMTGGGTAPHYRPEACAGARRRVGDDAGGGLRRRGRDDRRPFVVVAALDRTRARRAARRRFQSMGQGRTGSSREVPHRRTDLDVNLHDWVVTTEIVRQSGSAGVLRRRCRGPDRFRGRERDDRSGRWSHSRRAQPFFPRQPDADGLFPPGCRTAARSISPAGRCRTCKPSCSAVPVTACHNLAGDGSRQPCTAHGLRRLLERVVQRSGAAGGALVLSGPRAKQQRHHAVGHLVADCPPSARYHYGVQLSMPKSSRRTGLRLFSLAWTQRNASSDPPRF